MKYSSTLFYWSILGMTLLSLSACAQNHPHVLENGTNIQQGNSAEMDVPANEKKDRIRESKNNGLENPSKKVTDRKAAGDIQNTTTTTTTTTTAKDRGNTITNTAPVQNSTQDKVFQMQEDGIFFSIEMMPVPAVPQADPSAPNNVGIEDDKNMGISAELEDLKLLEEAESKNKFAPPVRQVRVKLSIQNRQTHPMWYLLPAQGEVELQAEGRFEAAQPQTAFAGRQYSGYINEDSSQIGQLVECHFRGNYQHGFKAFYLPPGSSITIRNYALDVWGELKEIELWGVKSLMVNGAKPLQDWLPFPVLTDVAGNLKISCPVEGVCTCKEIDDAAKNCTEQVQYMEAKDFKKYHLILP